MRLVIQAMQADSLGNWGRTVGSSARGTDAQTRVLQDDECWRVSGSGIDQNLEHQE